MTVGQLIDILSRFDANYSVVINVDVDNLKSGRPVDTLIARDDIRTIIFTNVDYGGEDVDDLPPESCGNC
jgi:hypothetical protein